MGKKNKFKKEPEPATPAAQAAGSQGGQGPSTSTQARSGPAQEQGQQRGPRQQGGGTPQQQQGQQRGPGQQGGGTPQQHGQQGGPRQQGGGTPQQQQGQQRGPGQQWGGTPQQHGQQGGPRQQGGGTPQQQQGQQRGPGQQGGGTPQQQGQQRGPGQQGGGPPRQQSGSTPQQQGQQQRGPGQQGGGTPQQQGQQQRGPWQQGGGTPQQQAWQQRGPGQQGGGTPQQKAGGTPQQQGGGTPQQQGWKQRAPGQHSGGTPQQQGWQQREPAQQGSFTPQQQGQQRRPGQQGGGTPQQQGWQQRGDGQKGGGTPQQQGWQQRGDGQQGRQQRTPGQQGSGTPQQYQHRGYASQRQEMTSYDCSKEIPSPCMPGDGISSAGIKRGTLGTKGEVGVNYLQIDISKMPPIAYHYDVMIEPDKPKKFLRDAFEVYRKTHLNGIAAAYDGKKSCYSVQKLPINNRFEEIEVTDSNARKLHFKIDIKPTDNFEIDLNSLRSYAKDRVYDKPMRALQCLEVALATPCHQKAVRAGRSFFTRPDRPYDLGDGYEAWTGLYQAAILGDQPFLNIDISHKSFPRGMPVTQYLERYIFFNSILNANTNMDCYKARDLNDFLRNMTVIYKPPATFASAPRNFRVNGVSQQSAIDLKFENENKVQVSIQNYFASKGYNLKYPHLPCLHVGSTAKAIYVPLELCEIPAGQAINRKDASKQVQNMIKYAATSTTIRKGKIMDLLHYFDHNAYATIRDFGIRIGEKFITVPTRILKSPMLEYCNRITVTPNNGSWLMRDSTAFLQTKQVSTGHKWAIIHFNVYYNLLVEFQDCISRQAVSLKVSLEKNALIIPADNLDKTFQDLKAKKIDLVFVILPHRGPTYADVKQRAELKYGILTQCIKMNTIEKRMSSGTLISNVLLKVNCKLNGANHKIHDATNVPLKNVMFLGADVTHPSPDQKFIPSVVGVAASHDQNGAMYNMQYRLQKSALEEIEDMESIIVEHLKAYHNVQKRYPEHIIYYRDGVSDGQFPIVKNLELRAIQVATAKLKIKVHLTCIIVVKRHHTRFFPHGNAAPNNKFHNVTPGTVVDRVIVHPNEMQFFMVSHQSIQGTAKPTRYNVIENTAKLDIDLLQTLTYNLCHMFPRCNRVVSYPAPAYLAHLVAFRGRVYLEGTSRFDDPQIEYKRRLVESNFIKRNPMYFV